MFQGVHQGNSKVAVVSMEINEQASVIVLNLMGKHVGIRVECDQRD